MRDQVHVCSDAESLAVYARDWLVRCMEQHRREEIEAAAETGELVRTPFVLALAGGSTPKRLYQLLAELPVGKIDWQQVILIWGDERNVPVDDPQSNYRMVQENLLAHIDIPQENVLGVPTPGGNPKKAATAYDQLLRERLPSKDEFPRISCVLLGMGDDVHTASLFPGTAAIHESKSVAVPNQVPKLDTWRITLTAPALNAARNVAFLISGAAKQEALAIVWHAPHDPDLYPSQLIRPTNGQLWFLLDEEAIGNTPLPESVMVQMIR